MTKPPSNDIASPTTPQHLHVYIAMPAVNSTLAPGAKIETNEPSIAPGIYLLVGDGALFLTRDQQELLANIASVMTGTTVQLVAPYRAGPAAWPVDADSPGVAEPTVPAMSDTAPPPVPLTKGDFHRFALKHRYNKTRAGRAWNRVFYADHDNDLPKAHPELPPIRYIGFVGRPPVSMRDDLGLTLDLRSVHERLIASGFRPEAWDGATTPDVNFLIHLVNEYLSVEPVLPVVDAH